MRKIPLRLCCCAHLIPRSSLGLALSGVACQLEVRVCSKPCAGCLYGVLRSDVAWIAPLCVHERSIIGSELYIFSVWVGTMDGASAGLVVRGVVAGVEVGTWNDVSKVD